MACPRMQTSRRGDFSALLLVNLTREAKRRPRPKYAVTPELQTANRLSYKRPLRSSRPRPQNTICYSPAGPGVGRSFVDLDDRGLPCVVSDSLVDNRGCLDHRTESQGLACDVNLQCRRPLDSSLDERLRERVFHVLLKSPTQRPCPIVTVRTRFLEDPLACFRRQHHLHLAVNQRVVQLAHQQIDDAEQVLVAERIENDDLVQAG